MTRPDRMTAVPADGSYIIARLEAAGAALLALPQTGYSTRLRTSSLDIVRSALDAYSPGESRIRPPVPSSREVDEMEQALAWIPLIPLERYVLRRIVGARALVNPMTGRHMFTWRRLAASLGADHKAVQRWHAQGIGMIVSALAVRK
jgi:hypothetical protein